MPSNDRALSAAIAASFNSPYHNQSRPGCRSLTIRGFIASNSKTLSAREFQLRRDLSDDTAYSNLQIAGGEGGIRTPDTRQGMAAFEAARFNHSRTSPHQRQPNCRSSDPVVDERQDPSSTFSLANARLSIRNPSVRS